MSKYTPSGMECLGIELGSTRIKAVLIDESFNPVASGSYTWENHLENAIWTYGEDEIINGLRAAYSDLLKGLSAPIYKLGAIGISAMMHGYLAFDKDDRLLVPFRTWRNTITESAAAELSSLFNFNIPQRWSVAHLYQAILNGEEHVGDIKHITTLAGYVHFLLTGERVLGIGDASGMFPTDSKTLDYDEGMIDKFSSLENVKSYPWNIKDILPRVLTAGENGGRLTKKGAKLLDESGNLKAGIPLCPPEGDAGTGMTATNSISPKSGNVSAGTSIFSMVILEKPLKRVHEEIDVVATPDGLPAAMVHCNNCCTDIDCWVKLFCEFSKLSGSQITKAQIYDLLYNSALDGDTDCGGVISFNYFSGEPVLHTEDGRPLLLRAQNANFNLSNFFRSQIFAALAALKTGMEILDDEGVEISKLYAHGGLFKTPFVAQKLLAAAMKCPVSVMKTAGEGGAWGAALLAGYLAWNDKEPLNEFLNNKVFSNTESSTEKPDKKDVLGFDEYMKIYKKALAVEKAACENIN